MTEPERERRARQALGDGQLRQLARALVHDDDAEDLVQEAIAVGLEQHAPPRRWLPWLRQVLRNLVRERARRRTVRTAKRLALVEGVEETSPEATLDRARMLDALEQAMAELDEPYHSAIKRRFFEDLTPLEMARQDGDPPATVRWRVHEGLRRIRASLDRKFGGRDRWCGAFAVALAIPLPQSVPATTHAAGAGSARWLIAVVGVVATTAAVLVHSLPQDRSGEPDDQAAISLAGQAGTVVPSDAPVRQVPESSAGADIDDASVGDENDKDAHGALVDALEACLSDLPSHTRAAFGRLELLVHAWTLEDGGALIERVDLTSGRKLTFADDVVANDPLDAPGVIVHDELATCVAYTLDTNRLPPWRDGWTGRIAATNEHTHAYSLVVEVNAQGDLVEEREPRPLVPVALDDAPVPDPESAVVDFGLTSRGMVARAAVRIIECGSYGCAFCKRAEATLRDLEARDPQISIAWLHLPLDQDAADLARAAVAADRQGQFWKMHEALFNHPKPIDHDGLLAIARRLDLDEGRFVADLADPETERAVARQRRVCSTAGAKGTPSFFINGDLVPGARGIEELGRIIDELRETER